MSFELSDQKREMHMSLVLGLTVSDCSCSAHIHSLLYSIAL